MFLYGLVTHILHELRGTETLSALLYFYDSISTRGEKETIDKPYSVTNW